MAIKETTQRPLRIGELARASGVSPDALRLYERCGLLGLPPRTAAGYRMYSQDALARVRLIRGALALGFRLEELTEILDAREHGEPPCRHVRDLAKRKLESLESRIAALTSLRDQLRRVLKNWTRRLGRARSGELAYLLESFVAAHPESVDQLSPLISPGLQNAITQRRSKHATQKKLHQRNIGGHDPASRGNGKPHSR